MARFPGNPNSAQGKNYLQVQVRYCVLVNVKLPRQ